MYKNYIEVKGARENNLKNISVKIPKNKLVAITGPSGSGKSTFAMDILQRECQRQYLESMGMVTDGLNKPNVDEIVGLSPAIGISQRGIGNNSSSTVGTYTEILTYLRILYAKIGVRICPSCNENIYPDVMNDEILDIDEQKIKCPSCKTELNKLTMANFSFNKPEGACKKCSGHGNVTEIDISKVVNVNLTVAEGAVSIWGSDMFSKYYSEVIEKCAKHYGFKFDASKKVKQFDEVEKLVFYHGVDSEEFIKLFPNVKKPKKVNDGYFKGIMTFMREKAHENTKKQKSNIKITSSFITKTCSECGGSRLGVEGRTVTVCDKTIVEVSSYDMITLIDWINNLKLSKKELKIAEVVIKDLKKRIKNLIKIGLSYLSLDRSINTLSGGEAQRVKLSNIIDSGLTGVLYVLDEPTTGLHPHDGNKLLDALKHIRDLGNTILVIEHDMEFVKQCDYVIDFGPKSGRHGGNIVSKGTPIEISRDMSSITGKYLSSKHELKSRKANINSFIEIKGANLRNLKKVSVDVPLNSFVCFTGVSGSGKSSLVFDVINKYYDKGIAECDSIEGLYQIRKLVKIDQKQIGRMNRSNVATYTEVFTMIREVFSAQKEAKSKKLKPSHFSFNVKGGRCEKCKGLGVIKLDMQFLEDIEVKCPVCEGNRFKKKVLDVKYKEKTISDVLNMTVEEAIEHFYFNKNIKDRLINLSEVGLGYLQLGQSTSTLSGGECQRIKLSKELGRENGSGILYLLDEPTTGLHPQDIEMLMKLLYKLKEAGNSIFVIEHSMEVISNAEYIVDLGLNGGSEGGEIIAKGTIEEVLRSELSHTSRYLKEYIGY